MEKLSSRQKITSKQMNNIRGYPQRPCICVQMECIRIFEHWASRDHKKYCRYVTIPGFNEKKNTNLAKYKNAYRSALYQQITSLVKMAAPEEKQRRFTAYHHFYEKDLGPEPRQCFTASDNVSLHLMRIGCNRVPTRKIW